MRVVKPISDEGTLRCTDDARCTIPVADGQLTLEALRYLRISPVMFRRQTPHHMCYYLSRYVEPRV